MAMSRTLWFKIRVRSAVARTMRVASNATVNFALRARQSFQSISRNLTAMNNRVNRLTSGLKRLAPVLGGLSIGGIAYGGKRALDVSADLEAIEKSIIFASGDEIEGAKNLEFLRKMVKDLALDYTASAQGFKIFSSSMIGSKFTTEDARNMYEQTAKAIRVMGLSAGETESVFLALGQMISKGKVQAQELRLQLGNSLPGAFNTMADAIGVTTVQLNKMMDAGNINTFDWLLKFTGKLEERFGAGVPEAMKTSRAQMTLMATEWTFFMRDIGDSIAQSGILKVMKVIVSHVRDWAKANKEVLKQKLQDAVKGIVRFGIWMIQNRDSIADAIKALAVGFTLLKVAIIANNIALMASPITWYIGLVLAVGAALYYSYKYLENWNGELNNTGTYADFAYSALRTVVNLLIGLRDIFDGNILSGIKRMGAALLDYVLVPMQYLMVAIEKIMEFFGFEFDDSSIWTRKASPAVDGLRNMIDDVLVKDSNVANNLGGENSVLDHIRGGGENAPLTTTREANQLSSEQVTTENLERQIVELQINEGEEFENRYSLESTVPSPLFLKK